MGPGRLLSERTKLLNLNSIQKRRTLQYSIPQLKAIKPSSTLENTTLN